MVMPVPFTLAPRSVPITEGGAQPLTLLTATSVLGSGHLQAVLNRYPVHGA